MFGCALDYSIDFLPVGDSNGDAICLRYGDLNIPTLYTDVIDGGYTATGEAVVQHLLTWFGSLKINNIVLTHADNDHARGLIHIMEACTVGALYMNRPWLFVDDVIHHFDKRFTREGFIKRMRDLHPYLVELEEIATRKRVPIYDAFQGVKFGCSIILAPSRQRYIDLIPDLDKSPTSYRVDSPFTAIKETVKNVVQTGLEYWGVETLEENPDPTSPSNETSVVQLVRFDDYHALFTGDAGPQALHEAADFASALGLLRAPNVFQIPHQGSRRNVTPSVLNRWLGNILETEGIRGRAACSVGTNKKNHPRKKVVNALLRRGYPTQLARGSTLQFNSPLLSRGWNTAPSLPFSNDVTEEE